MMKRKDFFINIIMIIAFVIYLIPSSNFIPRGKIIKVVCPDNTPPYSYVAYDTHKGFEADMWDKIGELSGYKIEMITVWRAYIFDTLDAGQADVAGNFLSMSTDWLEKYDVSIPYGSSSIRAVVDGGNTKINTLEDLKGKRIGISLGTLGYSDTKELGEQYGYEVVGYSASGKWAVEGVNQGKEVDVWIDTELTILLDPEVAGLDFKVLDGVMATTNVGYFVKKNDAASAKKLAAINSALEKMLSDGTVSQISQKWFGVDVTTNIK